MSQMRMFLEKCAQDMAGKFKSKCVHYIPFDSTYITIITESGTEAKQNMGASGTH